MQLLQYKPVSGGNYASLMDVTKGDSLVDWMPDAVLNSVQRENLAAAVGQLNNSYRQPLGNISVKLSIQLTTVSPDETTAAANAATVQTTLLGSKCHLKAVFGGTTLYYPNGVCTRVKPRFLGASTEFSIEIETDQVTINPV